MDAPFDVEDLTPEMIRAVRLYAKIANLRSEIGRARGRKDVDIAANDEHYGIALQRLYEAMMALQNIVPLPIEGRSLLPNRN
jgi:hypothetical protein